MQTSLDKPQTSSQKVKNILVRHSCSFDIRSGSTYQHSETNYILKYAPKYYRTLTLKPTSQSPLLSKVKKIKKVQRFNGYYDKDVPQQLWFDLLKNSSKEIEEPPQISPTRRAGNPSQSFWERLNERKLKYFWNVKRIWLHKRGGLNPIWDEDNYLSVKESFASQVWNLRKLESFKISIRDQNLEKVNWLLGKLDGMKGLFRRLEALGLNFSMNTLNIQELFQNKNFFSHLTDLALVARFDPIFVEIPQMCPNLKSIALAPQSGFDDERPEFRDLLTSLQQLTQLKSLVFNWPNEVKNVWSHIKPQASLEHLCLVVCAHHLINAGLSEEDKLNDIVEHWEELRELKTLKFVTTMQSLEEFNLTRTFVTKVLKKVQKLETLKIHAGGLLPDGRTYEPFSVEDVPQLHETLEKFEYQFIYYRENDFVKFNSKVLEPFKNLKSVKINGNILPSDGNVEEMVSLLQGNQREGEYSTLKLTLRNSIGSPVSWLRENLEALKRTKRAEKNLKVVLDLEFGLKDLLETLERVCNEIRSTGAVKGLRTNLSFNEDYGPSIPIEQVKEVLNKYPGMRNVEIRCSNYGEFIGFIRVDGEKEQFFAYN